jgi:hypothetical protein
LIQQRFALIIPESRVRPHTSARLYKKVTCFLEEQRIDHLIDIHIVTIQEGIVESDIKDRLGQMQMKSLFYPPKRFRSGRSVISKKQIEEMAKDQCETFKKMASRYNTILVYARGSYMKSLQFAEQSLYTNSCSSLGQSTLIFLLSEYELSCLKRNGILWMKMGLRMHKAFRVFSRRILAILNEEHEQLTFPI